MTVDIFGIADSARLQKDIPDDILAAIFLHGLVLYLIWFGAPVRSAWLACLLSFT